MSWNEWFTQVGDSLSLSDALQVRTERLAPFQVAYFQRR
jgi:hypothetical protein